MKEDLTSAGMIGLHDGLVKTRARGTFNEYARVCYLRMRIRGAVVDELRTQDWFPRRHRKRAGRSGTTGATAATGAAVFGFDDLPLSVNDNGIVDERALPPLEIVERCREQSQLLNFVSALPPREAQVIVWHYFEETSLRVIAERFGLSEVRVSQLHNRALERLRIRFRARMLGGGVRATSALGSAAQPES